jgi:thiol:disulfide interchange protein DsbD
MTLRFVKSVLPVICALALSAMLSSCGKERSESPTELVWLESYPEALELAQQEGKPIMIDFYADWCGWCKRLDSDTYVHESVVAAAEDFVSLKIDADIQRDLSGKFKVVGLPTILFVNAEGEEIHRVVGYRPPDKFVTELETAMRAFRAGTGS